MGVPGRAIRGGYEVRGLFARLHRARPHPGESVLPVSRIVIVAAIAVGLGFCLCARAEAMVEFCPAQVLGYHAVLEPGHGNASDIYGYKIGALGKRTVGGTIAIQTDAGWFTAPFSALPLNAETRILETSTQRYERTDFTAKTQFVRFPRVVDVQRMWVVEAAATGDGPFGWNAKGTVPCDPPGDPNVLNVGGGWNAPDPDEHPPTAIKNPFARAATPTDATAVDPPAGLDCAKPFVPASLTSRAAARWPEDPVRLGLPASAAPILEIALDARGGVEDVWAWAPSPYDEMTRAAIDAMKRSTFSPAVGLCRAVPSTLLYRFDWSPV